ncbi:MAG: SIMPL domain-containing protein [Angelakisella sp.]|jgi:uncharacterized protein YggE|nr:SIMPL domain-containing protein [Angelakisella sp.]
MEKFLVAVLVITLALSLAGCAGGAAAPAETTVRLHQEGEPETITVVGKSGMEATPDVAKVSLGVSSRAATPSIAREENTAAINATLAALAEMGIEEKDIQTTNMNMWNNYDSNGNLTGYRMSTDLTVYVRDITKAGDVVDAAIAAGANELNGVSYLLSNEDEMYNTALADAIALARTKAEVLAEAAGKTVGQVKKVDETSRAVATVRNYDEAAANPDVGSGSKMESVRTTIRPGSSTVSAEVQVVFEMLPKS